MAGSHGRTIAAVRRLRERAVPVQVKCTVCRTNEPSWETVVPWAESLGCDLSIDAAPHGRGDGDRRFAEEHNVDWERRVALHRRRLERRLGEPEGEALHLGSGAGPDEPLCDAGRSFCYVDPAGRVFPCSRLRRLAGDLSSQSFSAVA